MIKRIPGVLNGAMTTSVQCPDHGSMSIAHTRLMGTFLAPKPTYPGVQQTAFPGPSPEN
jgi:hypothetical protein